MAQELQLRPAESDHWQVLVHRLWFGSPDGKLYALHDRGLQPGAMWEASWHQKAGWRGEDGKSFVVKLPTGSSFPIDLPAADGGRWTRTGTPPLLTVTPSIHEVGKYHGMLTDGFLSPCSEGFVFPNYPETGS